MKKNFVITAAYILVFVLSAAASKIKVACLGNSVTYGAGLQNRLANAYPAVLQQLLGDGYDVRNFGRNGATLLNKGHNPYRKTPEFAAAIHFRANIYVIHLGLNDTDPRNWNAYRNDFKKDYSGLIDTLRAADSSTKIFVCLMTPIFHEHPRFQSGTRDWHRAIQEEIRQVAAANGAQLIDLHTPMHPFPHLFPDALHPNAHGATILAQTVYGALTGDFGGLQVADVFGDDMVLQRHRPIPIFGQANANQLVQVTLGDKTVEATTAANGKWHVEFPAMTAGGPYQLTVKTNETVRRFERILVGDVWLCAGQSNMEFTVKQASDDTLDRNFSTNKNLRLFKMESIAATNNQPWDSMILEQVNQLQYFRGGWTVADAAMLPLFRQ